MKHYLLSLLLIATCCLSAQTYFVGHTSVNFKDATRTGGYAINGGTTFPTGGTGRDIGTEIYYPATSAGDNKPFATGQFPVVVFGHGFAMGWDSYKTLTDSLVKNGYIVALPRTEGSLLPAPSHLDFGKDLAKAAELLLTMNTTTGNFFNAKLTGREAIGGHSMGGGATFLSDAFTNSNVVCYFTFAAAETNPSAVAAAATITKPHLVFSGTYDCVAPPATHQDLMYNALTTSVCRTKISLTKAYHCAFADNNFNCGFGEGTCITQGGLTSANQQLLVRRYLNPYLDYYLKGICPAWTKFEDLTDTITVGVVTQTCNVTVPENAAILGDSTFCEGSFTTLHASPTDFNYLWSDASTADTLDFNQAGTYTLIVGNGVCSLPSVSKVTAVKPLPTNLLVSTTEDTICVGDTIHITASALNVDYYQWTMPLSWQIVSGDSTNTITVLTDSILHTISVRAINECGNSNTVLTDTISYWPLLDSVSPFIGDWYACAGDSFLSTVAPVPNAEYYAWAYDGNTYTTTQPQFTTGAIFGMGTVISVKAVGKCSEVFLGADNIMVIDVLLSLQQNGDTLIATGGFQGYYAWYKDTVQIGTGEYFFPTENGTYTVKSNCNTSASINYIRVGIGEASIASTGIYPNPIKRGDMLQLPNANQVRVYNSLGALVYEEQQVHQINTAAFAAGIYVVVIDDSVTKLVVD